MTFFTAENIAKSILDDRGIVCSVSLEDEEIHITHSEVAIASIPLTCVETVRDIPALLPKSFDAASLTFQKRLKILQCLRRRPPPHTRITHCTKNISQEWKEAPPEGPILIKTEERNGLTQEHLLDYASKVLEISDLALQRLYECLVDKNVLAPFEDS